MNNKIKITTLIVIFGFLFFPIINDIHPFYENRIPHGVPGAKSYGKISLQNYLNKKWQSRVTERAKKNSGLWDPFLRISNQIMYVVFKQMGLYQNSSLFLGNEDYIIQTTHLREHNRQNNYTLDKIYKQLEKLKKIQDHQEKKGKAVILIISPIITSLYPELVPERFIDPSRFSRPDYYELIKQKIKELNILHVDANELLLKQNNNYPFRFFAKTAAHWNDIGSCLSLRELSLTLKNKNLPSLGEIKCDQYEMLEKPHHKDLDLLELANMYSKNALIEPTPQIQLQTPLSNLKKEEKPRILLVGTSYLLAYYKQIKDWELSRNLTQYFYFRLFRTEENRTFKKLRKRGLNWKEVLDKEILIINLPMSNFSGIGNGFIDLAESKLD
jgi:hypothetical protein